MPAIYDANASHPGTSDRLLLAGSLRGVAEGDEGVDDEGDGPWPRRLDAERRAEFDVWMSFMAQAQAESGAGALREHVDKVHDGLRHLCESLLQALSTAGALRGSLDLRREVERLHAFVDGLALHAVIQPGRTTPARVRQLVRHHIETLLA